MCICDEECEVKREKKLQLAKAYIERLTMLDSTGIQDLVSDDFIWHFTGPSLGFPDLYGKAGIRDVVDGIAPGWDPGELKMDVTREAVDGANVILEADVHGTMRDGRRYENVYLMWFEVSGGLIQSFRETADTKVIFDVLIKPHRGEAT